MAKRDIVVKTADGVAKAGLFSAGPAAQGSPGAILYMDAFGLRPALDAMAERLAAAGYTVLVPDLFYRSGDYGPFDTHTAFNQEATRARITAMMQTATQQLTERDSGAFLDALAAEGVGRVGVVGYCMGGSRAITAAAAYPERIAAAASFHGGNLASDAPDSPHLRVGSIAGRVYVGCAGIDRSFPPEQSERLAIALRSAGIDHVMENYVGMAHGWAVSDHSVFNPEGAERHWRRLLDFFAETLH